MHTITFTSGKYPYLLLLFRTAEIKTRTISATVHHRRARKLHELAAAGYRLVNRLVRLQLAARLIDIGKLNGVADLETARNRLKLSGDKLEKRRLARTIRTNDTDNAAARQIEIKIIIQHLIAERHLDVLGTDHEIAETRSRGNTNDEIILPRRNLLLLQLLVTLDTRLRLRMAP